MRLPLTNFKLKQTKFLPIQQVNSQNFLFFIKIQNFKLYT